MENGRNDFAGVDPQVGLTTSSRSTSGYLAILPVALPIPARVDKSATG
jgi:hypothetical protein